MSVGIKRKLDEKLLAREKGNLKLVGGIKNQRKVVCAT